MCIKIFSWNVFNPDIRISIKSWISNGLTREEALQYAFKDLKRFKKFRKFAILNIIKKWLSSKDKVVICLQEVNEELLELLLKIKNVSIFTISSRVTIVKGIENVISNSLTLLNDVTGLVVDIGFLRILNVHFYWKWTNEDLINAGRAIEASELTVLNPPYIICGDFNNNLSELKDFFDILGCVGIYERHTKDYTSTNPKTHKKDVIDHMILSHDIKNVSNIEIISKVDKYKIMYNFKKIYKNNSFSKHKYISDHLPIAMEYNECLKDKP